jgi:hypothetical protein
MNDLSIILFIGLFLFVTSIHFYTYFSYKNECVRKSWSNILGTFIRKRKAISEIYQIFNYYNLEIKSADLKSILEIYQTFNYHNLEVNSGFKKLKSCVIDVKSLQNLDLQFSSFIESFTLFLKNNPKLESYPEFQIALKELAKEDAHFKKSITNFNYNAKKLNNFLNFFPFNIINKFSGNKFYINLFIS